MSKKEREKNLRNDGFKKEGGVNYDTLMDRQVGDKRFERERANAGKAVAPVNSTIDTLQRMAAGVEGRTIADKINDANRPTWEQYKKDNESKLDLVGGEMRKMVEYRAELDREREQRLEHGTNRTKKTNAISDSDNDSDDSSSDEDASDRHKKKHKKEKKKSKKSKKHKDKKDKKKRSKHTNSNSDDNSSDDRKDGDRDSKKKQKTDTTCSSGGGSYRLSDFMNGGGYSSEEN